MNDDWRLRIDLREEGFSRRLGELLDAEEIEHDLRRSFHDRVVVSIDGTEVFCYAGSRAQAEAAEQLVRRLADRHGWAIEVELSHWHPEAERWEDPDAPLPAGPTEEREERAERIEDEREESAEQGYPELELRIQCRSRDQAGELSERLEAEGMPNLHRHSYVLIGVTDEASAQALSERLRGELPSDTAITIEYNRRAVYDNRLWSPFAVLGGLGG